MEDPKKGAEKNPPEPNLQNSIFKGNQEPLPGSTISFPCEKGEAIISGPHGPPSARNSQTKITITRHVATPLLKPSDNQSSATPRAIIPKAKSPGINYSANATSLVITFHASLSVQLPREPPH